MELVVSPVLQLREVPPLTERVTELPWQIVWLGVTVVETSGLTTTVMVSVFGQKPSLLVVTQYRVVCLGVTLM